MERQEPPREQPLLLAAQQRQELHVERQEPQQERPLLLEQHQEQLKELQLQAEDHPLQGRGPSQLDF